MPRVAIVVALAPLVINACGGHEPRETGQQSAAAARVSPPQDTSFAGATAPVQRAARPGTPPRVLRSVAATSGPGYDRVVFEFAEPTLSGWESTHHPLDLDCDPARRRLPRSARRALPLGTRGGERGRTGSARRAAVAVRLSVRIGRSRVSRAARPAQGDRLGGD